MLSSETLNALSQLEEEILRCDKCPELNDSRLYPMPGFYGNDIKLMVIGINPGPVQHNEEELLARLDFDYKKHYEIGIKSCLIGRFMNKALEAMQLTWDKVFFTNIIKCATPNIRYPTDGEVGNCIGYLERQLQLVEPKNLLLLGKFPLRYLDIDLPPMTTKEIAGFNVIVIYHPSYIRRMNLTEGTLKFLSSIKLK